MRHIKRRVRVNGTVQHSAAHVLMPGQQQAVVAPLPDRGLHPNAKAGLKRHYSGTPIDVRLTTLSQDSPRNHQKPYLQSSSEIGSKAPCRKAIAYDPINGVSQELGSGTAA